MPVRFDDVQGENGKLKPKANDIERVREILRSLDEVNAKLAEDLPGEEWVKLSVQKDACLEALDAFRRAYGDPDIWVKPASGGE